MFHPYRKDSSYLRAAILASYKGKCTYCGSVIQQRNMHVDHVIPSHMRKTHDIEVQQYLSELDQSGFIIDSIENYVPTCPACNIAKNNRIFAASNLRYYHEMERNHIDEILQIISKLESSEEESFYEPLNEEIWETVSFSYQRSIVYAIMGYRLTPADVTTCPRTPQVEKIKRQLGIVDYVAVEGEAGCGKSISLYQVAYDFSKKGWKVYRYKGADESSVPTISNNTENALYIFDDAQRFSNTVIESIVSQARPNAKILLARTLSSLMYPETILLLNMDTVKILYDSFLLRKNEIIPIVHQNDKNIGTNPGDLPIERRLSEAKRASTPWQFNYILRGGWQTMKEQYQTICKHHNCDLLATTIALFQIVQLDNSVDFYWVCDFLHSLDSTLTWSRDDLRYLVNYKIVLSVDDVRIIHMESAAVIVAQFLMTASIKKKRVLSTALETSFLANIFKPIGLVWLLNRIQRYTITRYDKTLISEKMITFALDNLEDIKSGPDRIGISFLWRGYLVLIMKRMDYGTLKSTGAYSLTGLNMLIVRLPMHFHVS